MLEKYGEDCGWFLRMYDSICKCMLLDDNSALWIYTKTSKYWTVQNVPCFIPFFFSLSQRKEDGLHCYDSMEGAKPRLYRTTVISNDHTFNGISDRDPIWLMQNRYYSMWLNHKLPQASDSNLWLQCTIVQATLIEDLSVFSMSGTFFSDKAVCDV